MHALVRFANIAAGNEFYTKDLHPHVAEAMGVQPDQYTLASLRYDLSKLRVKGLVHKVERTHRYRLSREGYAISVLFLKLFERIYAPLSAGLLQSVRADSKLQRQRRNQLDRLYQQVSDDIGILFEKVGIKMAA